MVLVLSFRDVTLGRIESFAERSSASFDWKSRKVLSIVVLRSIRLVSTDGRCVPISFRISSVPNPYQTRTLERNQEAQILSLLLGMDGKPPVERAMDGREEREEEEGEKNDAPLDARMDDSIAAQRNGMQMRQDMKRKIAEEIGDLSRKLASELNVFSTPIAMEKETSPAFATPRTPGYALECWKDGLSEFIKLLEAQLSITLDHIADVFNDNLDHDQQNLLLIRDHINNMQKSMLRSLPELQRKIAEEKLQRLQAQTTAEEQEDRLMHQIRSVHEQVVALEEKVHQIENTKWARFTRYMSSLASTWCRCYWGRNDDYEPL